MAEMTLTPNTGEVSPEMHRYDVSGSGTALSTIDYSVWANVGSVGSFHGDGIAGNRDALENGMPSDANYDGWSGSSSAGDYMIHNGKVYQAAIIPRMNRISWQ